MKVVANSSPLCYLRLIEEIHLLPKMFGKYSFMRPSSVSLTMKVLRIRSIREWITQPPEWLRVQEMSAEFDPKLERLHAEEREAILLARGSKRILLCWMKKRPGGSRRSKA